MIEEYVYAQPGHLIRRAHQLAWSVFMDETKALGVTPIQHALLVAMHDRPAVDATRLSELVSIDRATIGNVIHRLEARGFVTRKPDPHDRRAKRIFVTPAGKKMIQAVNAVRAKIGQRILAPLKPADRRTLLKLLEQLVGIDEVKKRAKLYLVEGKPARGRARKGAMPRRKGS